jgi:hypothetical protein
MYRTCIPIRRSVTLNYFSTLSRSRLTRLRMRRAANTDCRKLNIVLRWAPMAQRTYEILHTFCYNGDIPRRTTKIYSELYLITSFIALLNYYCPY